MENGKIVSIEDRIPKLKQLRKKKANRRLVALLIIFFILIALIMYFLSPLSRIKTIEIDGNRYLADETVRKSSGLESGSSIWNIDKKKAVSALKEKQKEIHSASVKVEFPNTVVIDVKEYNRTAYLVKSDRFYPIMENGKILGRLKAGEIPVYAPVLQGFVEGEALNVLVGELQELPAEILNAISEIHAAPVKTDPYRITLYMNDGYEVSATSRTLADKMVHYPSIVAQLDPDVKGVIDLEVGSYFKAFESSEKKE